LNPHTSKAVYLFISTKIKTVLADSFYFCGDGRIRTAVQKYVQIDLRV
jgi:hypothetical protein